jgi:hypothetical protein
MDRDDVHPVNAFNVGLLHYFIAIVYYRLMMHGNTNIKFSVHFYGLEQQGTSIQILNTPFGALRWTRLNYPTNFVMASQIFKLVCCIAVMLKQYFWWILLRLNSFETLTVCFQRPDLGVEDDWLPSWHRIHNNHFCTVPENSGRAVSSWQRIFELLCFFCFGSRHPFQLGTWRASLDRHSILIGFVE